MVLPHRLTYTGVPLDRAGNTRKDEAVLRQHLDRDETLLIPVWQNLSLLGGLEISPAYPQAVSVPRPEAGELLAAANQTTFLGIGEERAYFALDLSAQQEDFVKSSPALPGRFADLRQVGPLLPQHEAALLAYARGSLYWHREHQFCGRCGQRTESRQGGHMRGCTNQDCGRETYPRNDPAIITLVEHRPADGSPRRCLLGRHRRLPINVYTTLAGFVETGESLEETVAREIFEEAGIRVGRVTYQASQPWPFPSSLMLGFWADALTTEITIDDDELDEARWFTADELHQFGEWTDEKADFRLPRKDSIARHLVDSWLAEASG